MGSFVLPSWLETATTADVQAELDVGAEVMAWSKYGWTQLHLIITPHSAALTQENSRRMAMQSASNIFDVIDDCLDTATLVQTN